MGHRQDDRSSRMGNRNDGREGGSGSGGGGPVREPRDGRGQEGAPPEPQRGEPGRAFDRGQDMGGSGWSGASGRGGYPNQGNQVGYPPSQGGYDRQNGYGRYAPQNGYPGDSEYAVVRGGGHASDGRHEDHDDGAFLSEDSPGHVPNQRWSGGYGGDGDRDREQSGYGPSGPPSGRGFNGSDFGGLPRQRDRAFGAPAELVPRHFGTDVDRGGRMGPAGGSGYGVQGSDMGMGMGARDEDRGPHWGKGPKGYKRSDERTRDDVCDAIAHQGHVDASDVEVKVTDGVVTLSGTVHRRHDKRRLEHIAEHCRGVHDVHNELRLKRADKDKHNDDGKDRHEGSEKQGEPSDGTGSTNGNKNGKIARA